MNYTELNSLLITIQSWIIHYDMMLGKSNIDKMQYWLKHQNKLINLMGNHY